MNPQTEELIKNLRVTSGIEGFTLPYIPCQVTEDDRGPHFSPHDMTQVTCPYDPTLRFYVCSKCEYAELIRNGDTDHGEILALTSAPLLPNWAQP